METINSAFFHPSTYGEQQLIDSDSLNETNKSEIKGSTLRRFLKNPFSSAAVLNIPPGRLCPCLPPGRLLEPLKAEGSG